MPCCPIPFPVAVRRDEQLVVNKFSKRYVVNGPTCFFAPCCARIERRSPHTLDSTQYMLVRNIYSGQVTRTVGPTLAFLTEEEEIVGSVQQGVQLSQTRYCRVQNTESGVIRHVTGPSLCIPEHNEKILSTEDATKLSATDYLHIRKISTGKLSVERGPCLFTPTADEEIVKKLQAIALNDNDYARISDKASGRVRVEKGEALVFLSPTETQLGNTSKGVNVDANQAALLRDLRTGQLELITEPQVLVPEAFQELVEVRRKIRLEEYHTAVIKDNRSRFRSVAPPGAGTPKIGCKAETGGGSGVCSNSSNGSNGSNGSIHFIRGPTSFFLEPYTELLEQQWSSGLHKDRRDLTVSLFDSRPHFMWYEFDARTKDNVELMLGVTLFWGLSDVEKLVATTSDAAGDVCSHVRSMIIQAVSQMTLEDFLASFNRVVQAAVFSPTIPIATATTTAATTVTATTTATSVPASSSGGGTASTDPFGPLMEGSPFLQDSSAPAPAATAAGSGAGAGAVEAAAAGAGGGGAVVQVVQGTDPFYSERGICIEEIEVRSIACKDRDTQRVLQEIIKENTNRISRLQAQESANEVTVKKLQGEIAREKMREELLEIQQKSAHMEGAATGQAESSRIRAFMQGLDEVVSDEKGKVQLFNTLRKGEALKELSSGHGVSLYFTPSDVDLKIAT